MQADFSRDTFDPAKHFSAVLSQQGRVQLDADLNEQAAILLHQLRTAVADVVGPAGAPAAAPGFEITQIPGKVVDLGISPGRIYVDGILVENGDPTTYWTQPDGHLDPDNADDKLPDGPHLVYLRVWERLVTAMQDPAIREVALGDPGPDTAARAKVVWQVAALPVQARTVQDARTEFGNWLQTTRPTGMLMADAKRPTEATDDPCHLPPDARFRGPENQLYRIEVHTGGPAWPSTGPQAPTRRRGRASAASVAGATFKWSRENASVVFAIESIAGAVVRLAGLGRDGKLGLEVGDRVEIVDDTVTARAAGDVVLADPPVAAPRLWRVQTIDPADRTVTLDGEVDGPVGGNPLLRRWDHASTPIGAPPANLAEDGAIPIRENEWIDLEDGVRVRFEAPAEVKGTYRRGDYWLIPARTAIGDVLWPESGTGPLARAPHGVRYHHAPLAFVSDGTVDRTPRHVFVPLAAPPESQSKELATTPSKSPAPRQPRSRSRRAAQAETEE
ncbi:MAG TPA: DUF6519 domain-containing protein [Actinophytocola sp.]|uniref:DUF6519 domain-containing protein n=1 Tax=Actinophytocola sp. TaxID=1872138 RepID=UPI002DDCB872|nr:DUF6519 domain-containing protein [Actinophytocola sp.]HEV2777794.1 DUF6519 domain-containing protein [Actinophytocola sp.]